MSPTVALITCTGARPEAFNICEKLLYNQTAKLDQWVLIDDTASWKEGVNSQRPNMLAALTQVKSDYILIIEDDDYYAPNYVETMVSLLNKAPVVGLSNSRYYHVGIPGYLTRKNYEHASLCHTGFRSEYLPLMEAAVQSGELFFDIQFWKQVKALEIPFILHANSSISVGMKGMPGRAGIGSGHRTKGYLYDAGHVKLKEWVKSDYPLYEPYIRGFKSIK